MKCVSIVAAGAVVIVSALSLMLVSKYSQQYARHDEEIQNLRAQLELAKQAETKAVAEATRWESEATRLRKQPDELHRLRAEIARLTAELAKANVTGKRAAAAETSAAISAEKGAVNRSAQAEIEEGREVFLDKLPPAVATVVFREMENAAVRVNVGGTRDGKATYNAKGRLPDGRAIGLQVAADGTLLEKSTDVETHSVPPLIQSTAAQAFGNVPIAGARRIVEEGTVRYDLTAKSPESTIEMSIRDDGAVLGYSTKARLPKPEKR